MSSLLPLLLRPASDAGWNGHRAALSPRARRPPVVSGGHAGRQGTRVVQAGTARAQDDTRERRRPHQTQEYHRSALEQSHRGVVLGSGAAAALSALAAAANSALFLATSTSLATASAQSSTTTTTITTTSPKSLASPKSLTTLAAARTGTLDHSGRRRPGCKGDAQQQAPGNQSYKLEKNVNARIQTGGFKSFESFESFGSLGNAAQCAR